MNSNMRNKVKFIAALFFITIFTATIAMAQPGGGGRWQGWSATGQWCCAYDGRAMLLACGAAVYGRKKLTEGN